MGFVWGLFSCCYSGVFLLCFVFSSFFFFFSLKCKLSSETYSCKDYTLLASLRNQQGTCWKISSEEWIIIIMNLFYAWRLWYPPIFTESRSQLSCVLSIYFLKQLYRTVNHFVLCRTMMFVSVSLYLDLSHFSFHQSYLSFISLASVLMHGAGNAWFICDSLLPCRILLSLLIEAHHLYLCCGRWKILILSDSNSTNPQTQLSHEMLFVIRLYKFRLKNIQIFIFQVKNK